MATREQREPQIYDHYYCNFDTLDQPINTASNDNDSTIERLIFIHGRCKGDLIKPHLSYGPLIRSVLRTIRDQHGKKAILYMPEYHEFVGLEPYEPWSLKSGPISREIRDSVSWQIRGMLAFHETAECSRDSGFGQKRCVHRSGLQLLDD